MIDAPTPIHKMDRLSQRLGGPELYIKRDDGIGAGQGGNKARKLEFLIAEALARGCDQLVTLGGPQSNHCRQTALYAARYGLRCSLVLRGEPPATKLGNLLIDELLGADLHFAGARSQADVVDDLMRDMYAKGNRPYFLPLGGSTGLGALGYVRAMEETLAQLREQELEMDTMVLASSSAGTQAGLALGAALFGFRGRVLGISIDASVQDLTTKVREIALEAASLLDYPVAHDALRIDINADYLGGGYAVVGALERDAIRTVAGTEGLLLDPVYTGRAMGGLFDLIGKHAFDREQRIMFWHTGGASALSAFVTGLV
nr:D-cysteine desulfhydrase family protein [Luteimonas galliterrae]